MLVGFGLAASVVSLFKARNEARPIAPSVAGMVICALLLAIMWLG